jgi:outer membrane immunogenic protein
MSLRTSFAVAAAMVGAIASTPLLAADAPSQQPWATPNRVAAAWQGFYVGAHAGYTWARYDATLSPGLTNFSIEAPSFSGGVFAGLNFQVAPQFVTGFEADVTIFDPSGSAAVGGALYRAATNWQGTLRARAGMTFDNFLLYGTAGLALASIEFGGPFGSTERTKFGWALGAGVEARITDQISARLEYVYTNFGRDDYALGIVQRVTGDLDTHTLRVGVGYRF